MIFSGNKLNLEFRKRKRSVEDESDDELSEAESSDEDFGKGLWNCEVDGIKLVFKKFKDDNQL